VLICDGDVNCPQTTIDLANSKNIDIYTVLIGGSTSGKSDLQNIAEQTGGKFFHAQTAEEIRRALFDTQQEALEGVDTTDTDGDGLYDTYEIAGMIIPNGRYIDSDPLDPDTDDDGLTDGEEMGELITFGLDGLGLNITAVSNGTSFGEIEIHIRHFDYKSDPTSVDSDGDEYDDYDEIETYNSLSLINEVVKINWQNEYLSIKYTGEEVWNNEITNNKIGYGGNQSWFFIDEYWYDWFESDYYIENYGCGLISASDVLLYLSMNDSDYQTVITDQIIYNNGNIEYDSYCNYVKQMNWIYFNLIRGIGITGPSIASGIESYSEICNSKLYAKWCISKDKMLSRIKEMLINNIPVTLSIGPDSKYGVNFYLLNSTTNDPYSFTEYKSNINSHYVTVTGILIDQVKNQTMLKISSWGEEYYINYEEYINFVDNYSNYIVSNIVYITK
jgi:hypothetical protein